MPTSYAERVFNAPDFGPSVTRQDTLTFHGFGTVDGISHFLAYQFSEHPPTIYIVTCYRKDRP
jgi:hypothetical protein